MTDGIESLGRVRAQGLVLLAAVFLAGALAGGAVDRVYVVTRTKAQAQDDERGRLRALRERGAARGERRPEPGGGGGVESDGDNAFLAQFYELGLTDAQRERMRAIVAKWKPQAESIMTVLQPRVLRMEFDMREELACVLTPDQQQRWLAWRREHGYSVGEAEQWLRRARSKNCPAQ